MMGTVWLPCGYILSKNWLCDLRKTSDSVWACISPHLSLKFDHHHPLPLLPGPLSCSVSGQLDLALLLRGVLWSHCCGGWCRPDHSLLRLLLLVHYKSTQGKEAQPASVSAKDQQQPLPFRVLGQGLTMAKAKARDAQCAEAEKASSAAATHWWLFEDAEEETRRLLSTASCLIFFITMYKDFFTQRNLMLC